MLSKPVHIAIADENALFRKMLRFYLSEQKNVSVAVHASNIYDLINLLKGAHADVLLMDVFFPELNAVEALKIIRSEFPHLKILVVSMSLDMNLIGDLLDTGIHGYVSKADDQEDLLTAIMAVAENRLYRNKIFTEALYWNKQNNIAYAKGQIAPISERDRKILQLIWQEKSNKEIADELFLGIRSVEKIRQDLKEKIGAKSTIGLLKYAIKKRIIISSSLPGPESVKAFNSSTLYQESKNNTY